MTRLIQPPLAPEPTTQPAPREDADAAARVAAVYLHCPFCFHKCHYCDFYSVSEGPSAGDRQAAFVDRLCDARELEGLAECRRLDLLNLDSDRLAPNTPLSEVA